jgi:hypothetical protein
MPDKSKEFVVEWKMISSTQTKSNLIVFGALLFKKAEFKLKNELIEVKISG